MKIVKKEDPEPIPEVEVKQEVEDSYDTPPSLAYDPTPLRDEHLPAFAYNPVINDEYVAKHFADHQNAFIPKIEKGRWPAESAPGRIGHHPVLIYKFVVIDSDTREETMKCYTFSFQRQGKTTACYACAFCRQFKRATLISVVDGHFMRNPVTLPHVCAPKCYDEEKALRTSYAESRSLLANCPTIPKTKRPRKAKDIENASTNNIMSENQPSTSEEPTISMFYDAVVIKATNEQHPTMYYRTCCEKDLCWSFEWKREQRNGCSTFICKGCKELGVYKNVDVLGGKFVQNPECLSHVCKPIPWSEVEANDHQNDDDRLNEATGVKRKVKEETGECIDDLLSKRIKVEEEL